MEMGFWTSLGQTPFPIIHEFVFSGSQRWRRMEGAVVSSYHLIYRSPEMCFQGSLWALADSWLGRNKLKNCDGLRSLVKTIPLLIEGTALSLVYAEES